MTDKAFAKQRVAWLRKRHRQPLNERAKAVLGEQAEKLLAQARRTWKENPGWFDDFDSHIRTILRACVRKIPSHGSGLRRRGAYFRACFDVEPAPDPISVLELLDEDEIRQLSDEDWAEIRRPSKPPIQQLADKLGNKFAYFFNSLFCLVQDDPNLEDWVEKQERFEAIVRAALKARSPERYLRAVLRNEKRGKAECMSGHALDPVEPETVHDDPYAD